MVPSEQRFHAEVTAVGHLEDRLVDEEELSVRAHREVHPRFMRSVTATHL
jgi:hypothetical protein